MDPLSITATVISFVEVAKRIKDSVDKIGQNRETLRQLTSDVVNELTELQKLCQRREGDLRRSCFDDDSTSSLEALNSELNIVLDRCLQLVGPSKRKHISSMSYYIRSWIKGAEIEAHILRLRERVSSVHRRFTYISSMRIENTLLVVSTENQIRMNQMESLMSRLLIASHTVGAYPATLLDRASPGGIEFEYLRLQVQKIVNNSYRSSATIHQALGVTHEDPPVIGRIYLPPPSEPPGTLLRSTTVEALRMQQLIESEPAQLWTSPEGVMQLSCLAFDLDHLYLKEDSVAIAHWMITIYQALLRQNPAYMPYLAWGLRCLSSFRFGSSEGLSSAQSAVLIYGQLDATSSRDYSLFVALSRRVLSWHQYITGDYDNALESARQALEMQRKIPDQYSDEDTLIAWEASGDDGLVFTSSSSVVRSYLMAVVEGLCLNIYALSLAAVGRYPDACVVGSEAINCFSALSKYHPDALLDKILLKLLESRPKWASITYEPAGAPTGASITEVEVASPPDEEDAEHLPPHQGRVSAPLRALSPAPST
ncbi:hypothetical protein AB1N83_012202 [Pleurotus pulmonarius]